MESINGWTYPAMTKVVAYALLAVAEALDRLSEEVKSKNNEIK